MEVSIPDKTYFRIGEVSKILGVEPYVIRYWESEFKSVKPIRTKSDHRLYRRQDVQELITIRNLLYEDKFTIDGAKKQLHRIRDEIIHEDKNYRQILEDVKSVLKQIRKIIG
jgi:DNA-binding transcriptional MerR regulator